MTTSEEVATDSATQAKPGLGSQVRRLLKPNLVLLLLLPVFLLFLPRFVENTTLLQAISVATVFVMFAASWDILSATPAR
jgi:hypothetical protein